MVEVNISRVFRTKIDERIYSFDIIAVNSSNLHSSLIGYCIVNTREDSFIVELNVSIGLSNIEIEEIGRKALNDTKNIESTIFS